MDEDEGFYMSISFKCADENEAVRVVEAMSRPVIGLLLEGIPAMFIRSDHDE